MEDPEIVALYWQRSEDAIAETRRKYGSYCFTIANRLLQCDEDAEECVDDACLGAWNSIPPNRPTVLSTYLGKLTRRLALKRFRERCAEKRGGGVPPAPLEELEECVPSGQSIDEHLNEAELIRAVNAFLGTLPAEERRVFLRRYWYFDPVAEIAERYGFSAGKVKMMLKRTRGKLLAQLRKEELLT